MTDVTHLIWHQERIEAVLMCKGCGDVCVYTFPASMSPSLMSCEECGEKKLTSKIDRSKQF